MLKTLNKVSTEPIRHEYFRPDIMGAAGWVGVRETYVDDYMTIVVDRGAKYNAHNQLISEHYTLSGTIKVIRNFEEKEEKFYSRARLEDLVNAPACVMVYLSPTFELRLEVANSVEHKELGKYQVMVKKCLSEIASTRL